MSNKLTDWFPPEVKPVHVGVYQTDFEPYSFHGYSWWNGKKWGHQFYTRQRAELGDAKFSAGKQKKKWRGLAEKP